MVIVIAPLQVGVTDSQLLDTHLRFWSFAMEGGWEQGCLYGIKPMNPYSLLLQNLCNTQVQSVEAPAVFG